MRNPKLKRLYLSWISFLNLQIHSHACTQQFQRVVFCIEKETHLLQVVYETSSHFDAETNKREKRNSLIKTRKFDKMEGLEDPVLSILSTKMVLVCFYCIFNHILKNNRMDGILSKQVLTSYSGCMRTSVISKTNVYGG